MREEQGAEPATVCHGHAAAFIPFAFTMRVHLNKLLEVKESFWVNTL